MTTETTATAVPDRYPFPEWQEEGTFAVPAELRQAYAAAVPSPEVEMARQEGKGFRLARWVPVKEAVRLVEREDARVLSTPSADLSKRRLSVVVTPEEWLHVRRLEMAREATAPPSPALAPVTLRCAGCGASHQTTAAGAAHSDIKAGRGGLSYRLGLDGVQLCGRCRDALPAVIAAETLPDGRTRAEALAALLGAAGVPRAEADRQKVMEMLQRP